MVLHRTWHILYTTKQFYSLLRNFKIVSQFASWWPPSFRLLLFNFYFQVSMCMHFFWIKVSHWLANRPNWYISREYRRGRDRVIVGYTTTYAISVYHHKRCWVRISLMARCTRYNIMRYCLSVPWDRSVVFSGTPIASTTKTDRHDITDILLKVALNTITLTLLHL